MDSVQQAAQVIVDALEWDWKPEAHVPSPTEAVMPAAQALADAGLLVDTRCRKCNGTGGTDLGGAHCAVCDGSGQRRAET